MLYAQSTTKDCVRAEGDFIKKYIYSRKDQSGRNKIGGTRVRKRRVVGRIHGMKYSWKGYKDRNRHKIRIKRSGQARVVYVKDIKQPSLPSPFYSVLVSISVFIALSTVFHSINSPDNPPLFSLCSSCLNSALLVLSTIYLFLKVSHSPDLILCGWLSIKH